MRNASAKRRVKSKYSTNNRCAKTEDVLCNPANPVNPDSKPGVRGEFILKPVGEKTRSIASLHDDILPPGAK